MELREILMFLISRWKALLIFCLVFGICGILAFYYLPQKVSVTGTLYVTRTVDSSKDFFTYDGYYAQQTASAYSQSLIGLIESPALQTKVMNSLNIDLNPTNLRKLSQNISVKKVSNQVIGLTVKGNNQEDALTKWKTVKDTVITLSTELTTQSDSGLKVISISDSGIVVPSFYSLGLYWLISSLFGLFTGVLVLALKEYLYGKI